MSNNFKVALLQLNRCSNEEDAIDKGIKACKRAKEMNADIAVFPEMWNTGYELLFEGNLDDNKNITYERFEEWRNKAIDINSKFISEFIKLAKDLKMAIALTFMEKTNNFPLNTIIIIDMNGQVILKYSKIHTVDFKMEAFMKSGTDFQVCELDYGNGKVKLGTMICNDREYPESARILMLKGAEIILTPNACILTKIRLDELKVRAYENMVGIVIVNYANYEGKSSAFSPIVRDKDKKEIDSEILIMDDSESIKIAEFNLDEIRDYRRRENIGYKYRKLYAYDILDGKIESNLYKISDNNE